MKEMRGIADKAVTRSEAVFSIFQASGRNVIK